MLDVFMGAGDVARGGRFLFAHPRLLVWVIAPAVATLLVIAAVVWGVLALSDPAVVWVAAHTPSWLGGWVGGILRVAVVGGLSILGFFLFVSVAGLLAGPFCELLSEAVEEQVTGQRGSGFSLSAFARGLVVGVVHAVRRLLVYLFTLILVLILGAIVPVIGPALAILLGAYFVASSAAYDCFDAVFARRLWSYQRKLAFLRAHRGRTLGLGGATAALMILPVLNLFGLGFGATAATLAVLDLEAGAAGVKQSPVR